MFGFPQIDLESYGFGNSFLTLLITLLIFYPKDIQKFLINEEIVFHWTIDHC